MHHIYDTTVDNLGAPLFQLTPALQEQIVAHGCFELWNPSHAHVWTLRR
jgi:hypothetical protein